MTAGTLTSAGITAFYLERIHRLNPALHAVITVSPDAAAQARASDAVRAEGGPRSPLEGIPILVKDNIQTTGCRPPPARPHCCRPGAATRS